jgi:diguanylate cyclase (GGDEF)-like protein
MLYGTDMRFLRSLRFEAMLVMTITSIAMVAIAYLMCRGSLTDQQDELISERLNTDIQFLSDEIGSGEWSLKDDGFLYKGDICLGNGTPETADIAPFKAFENKTGTFCYVFKVDNEAVLGHVDSGKNTLGYDEGHFLRVAGSTLDPNGNSIVGSYMSKDVSNILDIRNYYEGEANVAGGMIYCVYTTIKDSDDRVVGAIVVGRSTSLLKKDIELRTNMLVASLFLVFAVSSLIYQTFFIKQYLGNIGKAVSYVKRIELSDLPDDKIAFHYGSEFDDLAEGVNSMVDKLRQTERFRKESETDALTGLKNRFGVNRILKTVGFENKDVNLAFSMVDIDYFKQYNDNYGHQKGDECLKAVSSVLKETISAYENCYCARFGGDEFVIFFFDPDEEKVKKIAEDIKERMQILSIPHEYSQVSDIVTLSQGIFFGKIPEVGGYDKFMHYADVALYKVKKSTRNGYCIMKKSDIESDQFDGLKNVRRFFDE